MCPILTLCKIIELVIDRAGVVQLCPPRTADRVDRFVQQTRSDSKCGEDGGKVGKAEKERAGHTPG